ncbi:MAG: PAS domain S-box protein [Methanospirillum sp.]|uniref:PAS domain S-box protein n=1 Tax=Methanospirillum sp. TaxID=45200 RepID=UPI002372F05A|nr:PAS domain S-box protein [Methanospirillum sp.]MDD1729681.1 PAS domain S-box protein [Methanospirillum sp.]
MKETHDRYSQIREYLQAQNPVAVSITRISKDLEMNRGSVSKYLEVLLSQGHVIMKLQGKSKLYTSSQKIPFDDLIDYLSDAIIILDPELHILMVNNSFIKTFNIHKGRNIIGTTLNKLDLPIFNDTTVQGNIDRIIQSKTYIHEILLIEHARDRIFLTEFIPTLLPSFSFIGKTGIMISFRDITAWKKTEDELQISDRKIRTLFEEVPCGIFLFQANGTILNANRASLEILGLTRFTDIAEINIFDIMCSREIIQHLIKEGKNAELTLTCNFDRLKRETLTSTNKSGVAYFQVVFAPVSGKGWKEPSEYFILFLDITEQKKSEKELKDRFIGITTNLPGIAYQFYARDTGEWGVYFADERSEKVCGLSPEPLETWFQRYTACIALEDRERFEDSIKDVIQKIVPWDFEGAFIKPTGERMYIRGISQPIRLKNETLWNGIFLDITDRRRAEEELRKSEQRFRGIASTLPGIVYQFYARNTGEWGLYFVDERSLDIYGINPEPLNTWLDRYGLCIAPEDQKRWNDSIEDVIRRNAPWEFEGKFIKSTREELYIRVISQPIKLQNETIWNGLILDITEYKLAENALHATVSKEIRYHAFFENTCNGVLIYEPIEGGNEYILKDVNKVTANLLRMKKEDLLGKKLFEEFPDLPNPGIRDMLIRVLTTEIPEFVPPLKYRNREDFPWISHYVFKLPSGEIASFMVDVSDAVKKETENESGFCEI